MKVKHPKYPELGIGIVKSETDGKATVIFDDGNKLIVFPLAELEQVSVPEPLVYKDGQEYARLSDVREEMASWVLSQCGAWRSIKDLAVEATQQFSSLTLNNKPFFDQGGFDPMFCITRANPGYFIKSGELIFRKAPKGSGYQNEFRSRESASSIELADCERQATEREKYVYVLAQGDVNVNRN